jgi:outer membrane protein TolC
VHNQLAFEVAQTFHTAQKTREFIRAAEAAVVSFETNLVIAERRQTAGALLKTEVLDLGVRLAGAREDLVRSRHAHALTLRALASLLGLPQETLEISDHSPSVSPPATDDFSGRPEMTALRHRQEQAEARLREARAGHLPRVDAFGSLDYDYGFRFDGSGRSYSAGILLQWDLWDGQLTRARVQEVEIQRDILLEEEHKLRLAIGLEAQEARQHLLDAEERLEVTARTVDLAEESVKLTRARFEEGLALASQLIDAETALTAARVRRLEAESNRRIAIAALRKALGLHQLPDTHHEPSTE